MENSILNFIQRRFALDCWWLTGNCFYFAQILKSRFPEGEIYYDVIYGHFLFKYDNIFYDWTGISKMVQKPIKWATFEKEYDAKQYQTIVRDCIL